MPPPQFLANYWALTVGKVKPQHPPAEYTCLFLVKNNETCHERLLFTNRLTVITD